MDKPWFLKIFGRSQSSASESVASKAERGDAEAQFSLGLNYANQSGAGLDYTRAAFWYLKAANQNHTLAQFNLATMYAAGQGVDRDDTQSDLWMRRAAQGGDAGAQYQLGSRCRRAVFQRATDLCESRVEAFKWYSLAAAQGYRGSDAALGQLSRDMSREEVAEGNHRAAMFTDVPFTSDAS